MEAKSTCLHRTLPLMNQLLHLLLAFPGLPVQLDYQNSVRTQEPYSYCIVIDYEDCRQLL